MKFKKELTRTFTRSIDIEVETPGLFHERLHLWIKTHRITRIEFSEKTGISESQITRYCQGTSQPTLPILYKIESATGRGDFNWILFGEES